MVNTTVATAMAFFTLTIVSDVTADQKWKKHGSQNGISVYTSRLPMSDVPNVRAVTVIDAPTEQVWNYITKTIKINGLKDRRRVGSCGSGCEYVYVRLGNWMMTDRHYIAKIKSEKTVLNGYTKFVRTWTKASRENLPANNAMNVSSVRGSWTLTPIENGTKTRVIYVNHLDLGGNIPPGLFSKGFVGNAYDILKNIHNNV